MKIAIDVPDHIKSIELDLQHPVSKVALIAKPNGNHVRIERNLTTAKLIFDNTYLQVVINEIAEALK